MGRGCGSQRLLLLLAMLAQILLIVI